MNFDGRVAYVPGRFDAFELRQVLVVKAHAFENRNQVGFVVTTDDKVNVVSKSLSTGKASHCQTANESWTNAEFAT
jgi:hypothetical protein